MATMPRMVSVHQFEAKGITSSCGENSSTLRATAPVKDRYTNPMDYAYIAIPDARVPRAIGRSYQHAIDIYAGETNKVVAVWRGFRDEDLAFRPHPKSSAVIDVLKHQLLSERRFFGEFL